jgi:hypothetical protein
MMEAIFRIFGNNNEINLEMGQEENYKSKESLHFCTICISLCL